MAFEPKEILVPTDYSDAATAALHFSVHLARATGARLTVLHAGSAEPRPEVLFAGGLTVLLSQEAVVERQKELDDYIARHVSGIRANGLFIEDAPPSAILHALDRRELGLDLVVMGTHGRTGFRQFLAGSVATAVLHHARVPVVTLRQWSNFSVQKVVCAIDDSWIAQRSARLAAEVARALLAELIVLRFTGLEAILHRLELPADAQLVEMELRDAPAEQIAAFAKGAGAGLLVIGSEHHRLGDRTIEASTSDVIARAECPVLTLSTLAAGADLSMETPLGQRSLSIER